MPEIIRLQSSVSNHFPLDSTAVGNNIVNGEYVKTLDCGRYFWKVRARDNYGGRTWSGQVRSFRVTGIFWPPGDFNGDGVIDIGDLTSGVNHLYRSGPAPEHFELGDANGDGSVNVGDVVFLINYLFSGGPAPF